MLTARRLLVPLLGAVVVLGTLVLVVIGVRAATAPTPSVAPSGEPAGQVLDDPPAGLDDAPTSDPPRRYDQYDVDGEVPDNVGSDGAIEVGPGGVAGEVDPALPVVEVFLDHACSYCATFEEANGADLADLAREGTVQVRLRPVAFLDQSGDWSGYSGRSVEAMFIVADGAPDRILEANAALFDLWEGMTDEIVVTGIQPSDDDIVGALTDAGVPEDVAEGIREDTYVPLVEAATEGATAQGVAGVPLTLIDGEEWILGRYDPGGLREEIESRG